MFGRFRFRSSVDVGRVIKNAIDTAKAGIRDARSSVRHTLRRAMEALPEMERRMVQIRDEDSPQFYGVHVYIVMESTRFGAFDIKPGMLAKATKRTKEGKPYVDVPFRLSDPGTFFRPFSKDAERASWRAKPEAYVEQGIVGRVKQRSVAAGGVLFRRISLNTSYFKWWHPGFRGGDLLQGRLAIKLPQVFEKVVPQVRTALHEAYERESRKP